MYYSGRKYSIRVLLRSQILNIVIALVANIEYSYCSGLQIPNTDTAALVTYTEYMHCSGLQILNT